MHHAGSQHDAFLSYGPIGPKFVPPKTSQNLQTPDSHFQQSNEALEGAERRPTTQKEGTHSPLDNDYDQAEYDYLTSVEKCRLLGGKYKKR